MSDNDAVQGGEDELSLAGVDYPGGFYREQSPIHLNLVCALNGVRGPRLDRPFTYCEIGCGSGETTAMLAVANPHGAFFGIDLSESHIDSATTLCSAADLANAHFLRADIAKLDPSALPQFDFITMHGLYSWVPPHVQAAIRQFVKVKLRPGGVLYLTYNALPGWGAVAALRRFFADSAAHRAGEVVSRVQQVLEMLQDMRDRGAPFFRENPTVNDVLDRLLKADPRYVAHEFLSASWAPRYFEDVHAELTSVGVDFVGDANPIENLFEYSVAKDLVVDIEAKEERVQREVVRDFVQNRFFRRDVYRKRVADDTRESFATIAQTMYFGFMAPPVQIPATAVTPNGTRLEFSGDWFERVKALLGYKALTLGELQADAVLQQLPSDELIHNIKLLVCANALTAFAERETVPSERTSDTIRIVPKLNDIRLSQFDWTSANLTLASTVSGAGIALNGLETVLLSALREADAIAWALPKLAEHELVLRSADGTEIEGVEATRTALSKVLEEFKQHKLPKLAYMGVVLPG